VKRPAPVSVSFTPGPWHVETHLEAEHINATAYEVWAKTEYRGMPGDRLICILQNAAAATEHNARLIAAAPELLEALHRLTDVIREHNQQLLFEPEVAAAEAAIAKAVRS
jgi:hypothetical protein